MNAALTPVQIAQTLAGPFAERAGLHDAQGSFPHENFQELAAAGLLSLAAAPHLLHEGEAPCDGARTGASLGTLAQVIGTIGQACPATALVLTMQYIQHRAISRPGSPWPEHLARRVVQSANQLENGRVGLINSLRVEPELGSPSRGGLPATIARRHDQGWLLSGHKIYSTGAPGLRWLMVWARTDEASPRVGAFLVDARSPGITIEPTWNHLGLRASGSHDVILRDVALPLDHAIGLRAPDAPAEGHAELQAEMAVLLGRLYSGCARAALEWTTQFLRERAPTSLGAPLATLPRMQEAVGHVLRLLQVNDALTTHLAQRVDSGDLPSPLESSLIKAHTTEAAVQAVQEAMALSSNHGLSRHNPIERHWRDVLCGPIHVPQVDAAHVAAGRQWLQRPSV